VNEKRGITADTATRLGRYFGTSEQYWLNIQNRFDLDSLDQAAIERDVIRLIPGRDSRISAHAAEFIERSKTTVDHGASIISTGVTR
jgi:hypothetical protein